MAKTEQGWNVLRIKTGQELNVHEMLVSDPVLKVQGVEVFTPFEMKRQRMTRTKRKSRQTPRSYASALLAGWCILRLQTPAGLARVLQLIEDKPALHGLLVRDGVPIYIPDTLADRTDKDGKIIERRHGISDWKANIGMRHENNLLYSYDPKKDARKNLKRVYSQRAHHLPELTKGEVVRLLSGPMQGIDLTVLQDTGDGDTAFLSAMLFGGERRMEVAREDIRKAS